MSKKARHAAAWLVLLFGIGACQAAPVETTDPADGLRPLTVEAVQVEVGVGSPIPVEVVASGSWPDLCAQLARVEQTIAGNRITIRLLATPADESCPPDQLGLPFRIAVPLNIVEMEQGTYSVDVNGVGTTFVWPQDTPEPSGALETGPYSVAYLGSDGNLWVGSLHGMGQRQVTTDGTALTGGLASDREVNYYIPRISSDGRYVAVRRDEGQTVVGGVEYTFSLMVYDLETGEALQVFDQTPAGFDWKPGTHLLAYALPVPEAYFSARGEVDASLAKSIMGFDVDSRTASELVAPEGSFAIYSPEWSPDGRYLAFEEVWNYEGSGYFAYYDFETVTYHSWDEAIGLYDWSPDASQIVYDRMTYTPTGEERIYLRDLAGGDEVLLSTDTSGGYAFAPAYSPLGDRVAYFVHKGAIDEQVFDLYIQDLSGGEPLVLGDFIAAQPIEWSGDGAYLFFSSGSWESQQISAVNAADGSISLVAQGSSPTVATKVQ